MLQTGGQATRQGREEARRGVWAPEGSHGRGRPSQASAEQSPFVWLASLAREKSRGAGAGVRSVGLC